MVQLLQKPSVRSDPRIPSNGSNVVGRIRAVSPIVFIHSVDTSCKPGDCSYMETVDRLVLDIEISGLPVFMDGIVCKQKCKQLVPLVTVQK